MKYNKLLFKFKKISLKGWIEGVSQNTTNNVGITFEKLLEKEVIFISFVCRISRSGTEEGRQRNKNLVFQIKKDNLSLLFNEIKRYNTDENKSY